ncbi:ATP-binding cassette sub-family G member 1, partial [Harpegnathos saltator]
QMSNETKSCRTLTNITHSQMIDVRFKDLSYVVNIGYGRQKKKQILKRLKGHFRSTELTAIMGPSGAGKSTLLNILSGFQEGNYTGTVEYLNNGNKWEQGSCKKQRCYIQQTDNLHGFFSIYEIMMIASYLKINQQLPLKSRQMLIDEILATLKLSLNKQTRVDRLSGGQKKKLSIALELIGNPPLMFLDEPTTGLDSTASVQCITMLKNLAQSGRTIICTIHQPSAAIYQIFDHIYLVVDGHCMYRSSPDETIGYFARQGLQCPKYHNPADYMLEVVSGEYGDYHEQLIATVTWLNHPRKEAHAITSSYNTIEKIPDNGDSAMMLTRSPPTELMRFWILLQRSAILVHRDYSIMYIKLFLHFLVAVLLGLLYEHAGDDSNKTISNISYLMVSALYIYYTGMMPAVLKFPLEIDIVRKERFNNWYKLRTYYIATIVCALPLHMAYASIYSVVSYFMTSQPLEYYRFFMYLLIAILNSFISEGMGLSLGAIFNPVNGTFLGSIIVCIMLCLAGFLIFFTHMPRFLFYISYLSVLRYTFEGFMYAVYDNRHDKIDCSTTYCHYRFPNMILEELGITKSMFWHNIVVLFGYFVMFWIVAYLLLKRRL